MFRPRDEIPPHRKGQHSKAGLPMEDQSTSRPSKRLKLTTRLHSAAFYDSLSKVWLTPRALKEFDRRTRQANGPQQSATRPLNKYRAENLKQIQRSARRGGLELEDLRGYRLRANVNIQCKLSSKPLRSKISHFTEPTSLGTGNESSSAYDNGFEQHLIDHMIYPKGYKFPDGRKIPEPDNIEDIRGRLAQRRPSLSPSNFTTMDFRAFHRNNDRVIDEAEVMRDVVPIICGDSNMPSMQKLLFTQLVPIINNTTVDVQPSLYDGARLGDIDEQVREDLGSYIIPTTHRTAPVAPNFFLEVKSPNRVGIVAKRQVCYDGALGSRAMQKLQSYGEEAPVYDGKAYTVTATYQDGQLVMYTTHPTPSTSPGNRTEYHMTEICSWYLTLSLDEFRQGATALRNARDWAQEQRNSLISATNARGTLANNDIPSSPDELALDK